MRTSFARPFTSTETSSGRPILRDRRRAHAALVPTKGSEMETLWVVAAYGIVCGLPLFGLYLLSRLWRAAGRRA
jgi:hypothetical protein